MVMDWLSHVGGVREVVVCAGARNTPLLVAAEQHKALTCWRHFDERSAGFFALGRAQGGGDAVAVIVTSGTAVAELLPAVVEAHYSGVPLFVVAGDRPADWRGGGAPQSIDQVGMFGRFACEVDLSGGMDADAGKLQEFAVSRHAGGVGFINVCLPEPLLTGASCGDAVEFAVPVDEDDEFSWCDPILNQITESRVGVVVGDVDEQDRHDVAASLAKLGLPVWAEVTSGLHAEPVLHELLVGDWSACFASVDHSPQRIVRVGGVPNGRFWRDLEERNDIAVTCVSATGLRGLGRDDGVSAYRGDVVGFVAYWAECGVVDVDHDWLAKVYNVAAVLRDGVAQLVERFPESEPALVAGALRSMRQADAAFFGNSMAIREAQLVCNGELTGGVFANRGANGIDGQLSSFIGAGCGRDEAWGVFGDLTTLYDFSAPWMIDQMAAHSASTRWRVVVVNNGGGQIFSRLPYLDGMSGAARELLVNDSSNVDFSKWAGLWNMDHLVVGSLSDWQHHDFDQSSRTVIELRPDSRESDRFWDAYRQLTAEVISHA